MKRLVLTVAIVALLAVGSSAMAATGGYQWSNSDWDATMGAFSVHFMADADNPYYFTGDTNPWYFYQWDISLASATADTWLDGSPGDHIMSNPTEGPLDIYSIRGFAFVLPDPEHLAEIRGLPGYRMEEVSEGVWDWVALPWDFSPEMTDLPPTATGGSWTANNSGGDDAANYLWPGELGRFSAGFYSNVLWTPGETYDVQFHVNTSGESQKITWNAQLENMPPPTPELSTWVLLACAGLFGVGFMKRRKA
jgi:hypothetical protein